MKPNLNNQLIDGQDGKSFQITPAPGDTTWHEQGFNLPQLIHHQQQFLLGVHSSYDQFTPCKISLTPWQITQQQFNDALVSAKLLSRIFYKLSQMPELMLSMLQDYKVTDTTQSLAPHQLPKNLLSHFKHYLHSQVNNRRKPIKAIPVNLSRQDLLYDQDGHWKLVESNSIAAGMGPFSEVLSNLLESQSSMRFNKFAPNPAIYQQAATIFNAAKKNALLNQPVIVFLIAADEDNIYDQNYLINQISLMGAIVKRLTLIQLKQQIKSKNNRLYLSSGETIDCIYYRTGYNYKDYIFTDDAVHSSSAHSIDELMSFRQWIEQHQICSIPTINHQVATSKWIQMKLSQLSIQEIKINFELSQQESENVKQTLANNYQIISHQQQIVEALKERCWILKSQHEGGNSVYDISTPLPTLDLQHEKYLLMQKINSVIRQEEIHLLTANTIQSTHSVISELGIFTVGNDHHYGGYLLRSKPANQLQCGVHSAGGFLDTLVIADK
ncbi:hypothetical protein [Aliikangiella maris]|uniref:glutathione synthase n=2 Tax=Aliikangiella maris TaxID=3162458 RepID=A0ABV2BT65_9GAMM